MKSKIVKAAALSIMLGLLINTGVFAQYSPSTTNSNSSTSTSTSATKATPATKQANPPAQAKQAQPKKAEASPTHKMMTKKDWEKRYNEIKPKVEALANKAKTDANADLTAAVTKMDKLSEDFGDKVDKIDNITSDKREAFEKDLRVAQKEVQEQYEKTKALWNKAHPEATKKDNSKATPANPA